MTDPEMLDTDPQDPGADDRAALDQLTEMWRERDPAPDGLVSRMQALARAEVDLLSTDWDHELLQLVERSSELVGARSGSGALTLRFAEGDVELMVRIVEDGSGPRIDGWVLPAMAMSVAVLEPDGAATGREARVDDTGRFEVTGLARGLVRLCLDADDPARSPILTPTFEI